MKSVAMVGCAVAMVSLTGCGSSDELPPAAEPPVSPPAGKPAGRVVKIGEQPEGLVADSRTNLVVVGLRNPDRLVLADADSGKATRRVRLSESPRHLSLVRPGGPVLVPAERSDQLIEVALPSGRVTETVAVGKFPHDAAASDGRIFVADEMADAISVVEGGKTSKTLSAPQQPGGIAATPNGKVVVVAVRERVLRSYDARTLEANETITGGIGPTHIVSDCSDRVYVADTDGKAVLAYRVDRDLRFVDRLNLANSPYGLAVDCRRRLLWVTQPANNRLVVFRIPKQQGSARRLASFPTVRQPNTVATDERSGRVYVASRTDGELQIIDPGYLPGEVPE